ncbi:MFS transporter [Ramlibacter aurantiacus]|uniref:MFS transporter n=1 Tax=Ramlibacter aurantiacus TaxID=2801330 RepID=UPI00339046B6
MTLTVSAALFMLLLDTTILNTSLPAMAQALRVPPLTLSAAITIYLLAGAAVLPLAAWLGERFGLRRVFALAIGLFTVASLLCGLADSATELVLARALQGAGGGLMMPVGRTLALRGARREDLIRITAVLIWPALFAPVIGPPLGGFITTYFSWRWNFFINVPLGLAAIALILRWVPRDQRTLVPALDIGGALGAAAGLILLLGGLEWSAHATGNLQARLPALTAVAAGLLVLGGTVAHLRRTPHPVVSLAPLSLRSFRVATFTGGTFATMCLQATPFLLPLLFQLVLGLSAVDSGLLLLPYFFGNLAIKPVTTFLLMRFGFRRVLVGAGLACALAIGGFGFIDPGTPWAPLVLLLLFAGCLRSILMTTLNTLMFVDVPAPQRAPASSLSSMSFQVSSALGVAVGAMVLATAQLAYGHTRLGMAEFQVVFIVVGLFCALATVSFWRLPDDVGADITNVPVG